MPTEAFEITANESNDPNKAKLELKLIIWFAALSVISEQEKISF